MARSIRSRCRLSRQLRTRPYPLPSYHGGVTKKEGKLDKASLASERRDWKHAKCSVCMEYPHNAVLLLCSSHDKGCRPYMCGTSYRHSNCLDQFKKAYAASHESYEEDSSLGLASPCRPVWKNPGGMELACPLCRGQVKGWTVVEPARKYLNKKKRGCMQDGCSFVGTYRELRKHVRAVHPRAKSWEVDPALQQKWKTLEHQTDRADVISTIRATMPRAVVMGDYVIDMADSDPETDEEDDLSDDRLFEPRRRGINRDFLWFLFREGARFMRLRGNGVPDTPDAIGRLPVVDDDGAVPTGNNSDDGNEEDDDDRSDAYLQLLRSERLRSERRRRLRRIRGRGRFASGLS